MRRRGRGRLEGCCALAVSCASLCAAAITGAGGGAHLEIIERIYARGLQGAWQDQGWAPRDLGVGRPVMLDLSRGGGWIVSKEDGGPAFDVLRFRLRSPSGCGGLFRVRLRMQGSDLPTHVDLSASHCLEVGRGWWEVAVSARELNRARAPFDAIVFQARTIVTGDRVTLDDLVLLRRTRGASVPVSAKSGASSAAVPCVSCPAADGQDRDSGRRSRQH